MGYQYLFPQRQLPSPLSLEQMIFLSVWHSILTANLWQNKRFISRLSVLLVLSSCFCKDAARSGSLCGSRSKDLMINLHFQQKTLSKAIE